MCRAEVWSTDACTCKSANSVQKCLAALLFFNYTLTPFALSNIIFLCLLTLLLQLILPKPLHFRLMPLIVLLYHAAIQWKLSMNNSAKCLQLHWHKQRLNHSCSIHNLSPLAVDYLKACDESGDTSVMLNNEHVIILHFLQPLFFQVLT